MMEASWVCPLCDKLLTSRSQAALAAAAGAHLVEHDEE